MAKSGKFGALANFRQEQPGGENGATASTATPAIEPKRRGGGKKSNPDYEPTTILMRKQTKKAARRKLEDTEAGQDLSDKIDELLTRWISESA